MKRLTKEAGWNASSIGASRTAQYDEHALADLRDGRRPPITGRPDAVELLARLG